MEKRIKPIRVDARVVMDQPHSFWGITCQILLLFTGLASYLFCNSTALGMDVPAAIILLIAAVAFGLMILLTWFKRVFFGILGGVATLSLIAYPVTFPLYRNLFYSLEVCYNYTIYLLASQPNYSDYKDYFTLDIEKMAQMPGFLTRHFYSALILLAIFAAVFFALALFRRIPPIVSFLVPMAGLVPFFFYGIVPHYFAFSIFLSAMIGCYAQSVIGRMKKVRIPRRLRPKRAERKKEKKKQKQQLTTAQRLNFASVNGKFGIIVTAVMLIITMGTASFIYTRPVVELTKVRQAIDTLSEDAMNLVFAETYERNLNIAGYMEEGEKLQLGVPKYRRIPVATVESTTSVPIYLRYRTTVNLDPDGWTVPDDSFQESLEYAVPVDFRENTQFFRYIQLTDASALNGELDAIDSEEHGFVSDVIKVTPKYKVSNLLGIPGGTVEPNPSSEYQDLERLGDTVLLCHDKPDDCSYTYAVVSPLFSSNTFLEKFEKTQKAYVILRALYAGRSSYMNDELSYSIFVRSNYLTVDEDLRYNIQPLARELTDKYDTALEKTQAIERYFRENYTYSTERVRLTLQDGSTPTTYDELHYFIKENEKKQGYCTLFASSMVMMLRSINIPARVASGYYVTPDYIDVDQFGSEINDAAYHAWPEVYLDGLGWVPFEPTPGFGVERNYHLLELADKGQEPGGKDDVKIEYISPEDAGIVIYDKIPDYEVEAPQDALEVNPSQGENGFWQQTQDYSGLLLGILIVLFVLALVFGLWRFYRYQIGKIRKLPPKEGVEVGYVILLRMMQMRGFKFFEGELLESFARRADNLDLAPQKLSPVLPILQKALFGNMEIGEEERAKVADYVESLNKSMFLRYPHKVPLYLFLMTRKPRHHKMIWKFK